MIFLEVCYITVEIRLVERELVKEKINKILCHMISKIDLHCTQ